jgi:hypothetical protein
MRVFVGISTLLAAMAAGGAARAHGDVDVEKSKEGGASAHVAAGEGEHAEEGEEEGEEEEGNLELGLDLVLGWGKGPFAVAQLPTSLQPLPTYVRDEAPGSSQSFILDAAYKVGHGLELGLRLPFAFGRYSPHDGDSRATTAFGNVEVEAEYEKHLGKGMEVFGALGLALPTAGGTEIPPTEELQAIPFYSFDQNSYDRWAVNHAAAASRGYEDNALFEPKRFGIIPKIGHEVRMNKLVLEPYVKVENLIATSSSLENSYVGELVPALRAAYALNKHFEPGLRAWANIGFAGGAEDKKTNVVIEPQVVGHFGGFKPYVGVIVPVAGPLTDAPWVGVRLGAAGAF